MSEHPHLIVISSPEDFDARVADSGRPAVIDFWASWCGPCRALAPIFEQVAEKFHEQVDFVKVDTEAVPQLSQAFGVRSLPTVVLFHNRQVKDALIGVQPRPVLEKKVQWLIDKAEGKGFFSRLFGSKSD